MGWNTAWSETVSYLAGDVVRHGADVYRAISDVGPQEIAINSNTVTSVPDSNLIDNNVSSYCLFSAYNNTNGNSFLSVSVFVVEFIDPVVVSKINMLARGDNYVNIKIDRGGIYYPNVMCECVYYSPSNGTWYNGYPFTEATDPFVEGASEKWYPSVRSEGVLISSINLMVASFTVVPPATSPASFDVYVHEVDVVGSAVAPPLDPTHWQKLTGGGFAGNF